MTVDDILNADFMLGADSEEDGEVDEDEVCALLAFPSTYLNPYREFQMPSFQRTKVHMTTIMLRLHR